MDEIRRQLALIDEQRSGRTLQTRLVSTAPLFFPAAGLMVGIALQNALTAQQGNAIPAAIAWTWLVFLGVGMAVAVAIAVRDRRTPRPLVLAWGTLVCFACLGAIRLIAFERTPAADIRNMVRSERVLATIRGRIVTPPSRQLRNWRFASFVHADPSMGFYLDLEAVRASNRWQPARGTIRVDVDEPTLRLAVGARIRAYCWLSRFEGPTNPGQFDFAAYLRRRNVHVGASVPAHEAIERLPESKEQSFLHLRSRLAGAAKRALLGEGPPDGPAEGVLEALLLGRRRHIDPETYEAFRKTGLLHLISLSGMHLGILIGLIWWAARFMGLLKPGRAVVCIVATAVFLLVVPSRAPTLRAAVIVWAYCVSILVQRRTNPLNSLSLAAIILLLIRPTELFEAGWQLSFAAVAGILAFTRPIERFIMVGPGRWLGHQETSPALSPRLVRRVGSGTVRLLSAGLAAWLGGAGIVLYHFYTISPLAALLTALAALPVAVILTLGFLKVLMFFVLPTLSMLLGQVLTGLTEVLIRMVRLMAEVEWSHVLIGHVPAALVLAYYALIVLIASGGRRSTWKTGLCATTAVMLVIGLGALKWQRTHRDDLRLTCLDVGHGQAILVQLPGTRNLLFDAGALYSGDVGTRVVLPFLDYSGIDRLHAVVVSHCDIDHINGIPEVVARRRVDRVYIEDATFDAEGPAPSRLLWQSLKERKHQIEDVPEVIEAGPARITRLWPTDECVGSAEFSDNDRSLVCLIEFAGRRLLLCSDIETGAQQAILTLHPDLQADVVVVPHHGSVRTLAPGFLERLRPSVLICSCGRRAYERGSMPTAPSGSECLVTARDEAISVCIDPSGRVQTCAANRGP